MAWFKNKQVERQKQLEEELKVEIPKNKAKQQKVISEANKVAEEINRIVSENGFHLKLYVAVSGHRSHR